MQNCHFIHELAQRGSSGPTSVSFMLNKSSTELQQSAHLKDFQVYLQSVHSFILCVATSTTYSSYKNRGPNPHLPQPSFIRVCGPPICSSNLSLVSLKCQRGGVNMYLLAMDFSWNAPSSVHPATLRVLIGSDYGVFVFLVGVGTQPVSTLPMRVGCCFL